MFRYFTNSFFDQAFGFPETQYDETRDVLLKMLNFFADPLDGKQVATLKRADGVVLQCGTFTTPTVEELIEETKKMLSKVDATDAPRKIVLKNITGDVTALHKDPAYKGAVFQAASQFNCLEMVGPTVTPERGISCYASDRTQGPACAIACAAGTAFRNFLVDLGDGQRGQTTLQQVECLSDINAFCKSKINDVPWITRNGYVETSLERIHRFNKEVLEPHGDEIVKRLRIGVQRDTQVTSLLKPSRKRAADGDSERSDLASADEEAPFLVTQTYNSAVSVGYSMCPDYAWAPFAGKVLEGSYLATLHVGIQNNLRRQAQGLPPAPILLTKVGGGVFRNDANWIKSAINVATAEAATHNLPFPLELLLVHYGSVESEYTEPDLVFERSTGGGKTPQQ